jgi:hypothetical protein|tara:strand:+ start:13057 stop:14019 length:963 start_codon:yes stop_codon:yes gene_type:complete
MIRKIVFIAIFFLIGCVENLVNITVLKDGSYLVKYTSIGNKSDLLDIDFKHPESNTNHQWVTNLSSSNSTSEVIWEKETILTSPTRKKLVFSSSSSLQYSIDISKKSFILWTNYYFNSNIKNLEIDKKYPEINQYLNINQSELEWMIPVKKYIFSQSIEKYRKQYVLSDLTIERIDSQINSYISYVKEKKLEKDFSKKTSQIFLDALMPIKNRLPEYFFDEMNIIINEFEKEFEKNTSLMSDNFLFSIVLPGQLQDTNAYTINDEINTLYWEFNFNDIATNSFNMYAHSLVINNLWVQLLFIVFILLFIRILWNRKQNEE